MKLRRGMVARASEYVSRNSWEKPQGGLLGVGGLGFVFGIEPILQSRLFCRNYLMSAVRFDRYLTLSVLPYAVPGWFGRGKSVCRY